MAGNYLIKSRHGTMLYFRRRVPDDLRHAIGKPYLVKSLGTGLRREAIMLARAYAAHTDNLFLRLRAMPQDFDSDTIKIDFGFKIDLNEFGKVTSISVTDAKPDDRDAVNSVIATALQNLPTAPTPTPTPTPQSKGGKTISDVWDGYKADKIATSAWKDGENTAKYDHWPHVRTLIEVVGDRPIADITADDINEFQTHVLNAPNGGAPNNRKKRLGRAGALFKWAKKKRITGDNFDDLFQYPGKIEKNRYVMFNLADLKSLFESETYRQQLFSTPSEYWLPILGLHTGARLNELCQLTKTDVGEHDGIPTISILDEDGKRLKNTASRRIVPIHSKLIELGFLEYVATINDGRIFPELPEDPARPGNFSAKPSEAFTAYRRGCGVGELEVRSRKVFHSFRSTLISALRKAHVPKDRRTRLAGHEYEDAHDRNYDGGDALTMFDFATLKADIEMAKFDVEFSLPAGR
ncbi:site-specific integrase [Denitromonas ohlonensis]|uniref:Site-specific integrase n=2 Tax=Denitromonas TaxID=139331 RepID=A0A557R5Y1_9RHOO|nr:site-specific integrase [Denitromonas ohlonensis]TVO60547.1 site-specific integrase [Denitromonas ohlonensis]TVO72277.1 site-specific integrase [Denitromonas ohlonensis]